MDSSNKKIDLIEVCINDSMKLAIQLMVFNAPYGYNEVKSFSGKELSFDEFKEQYLNAEFEIVTEGYCGYDITFQGYIWQAENDSLFGIMRIWNIGDMVGQNKLLNI